MIKRIVDDVSNVSVVATLVCSRSNWIRSDVAVVSVVSIAVFPYMLTSMRLRISRYSVRRESMVSVHCQA